MSFVQVAPDSHFPIENLPYGVFSTRDNAKQRIGVAIGEQILDLSVVKNIFNGPILSRNRQVFDRPILNEFMALPKEAWHEARETLQRLLSNKESMIRDDQSLREKAFVDQKAAIMHLPTHIGGYVNFASSKYYALNLTRLGMMSRGEDTAEPDSPLPASWQWCPIGCHARASSVVVSGASIRRPHGETIPDGFGKPPIFKISEAMDVEMEMGYFLGGQSSALGHPVPIDQTQDHIFGMVLLNNWISRDIQKWEHDERGPFTATNLGTSISPWVVTMEALEPFVVKNAVQDPFPMKYLRHSDPYTYDINLELSMKGQGMKTWSTISRTNFRHMYWTMKQQIAHYTISGCNIQAGDLMGSGAVSGPDASSWGTLLELTHDGQKPIHLDGNSKNSRTYLENYDEVTLKGWSKSKDGNFRIGFGECYGVILPH